MTTIMKRAITFYAEALNGKIKVHKRALFQKYLDSLKGLVSIEIKERRAKRSLPQNAYYWLCLTIIGDELGYSKEEMHDLFGLEYRTVMSTITIPSTGEVVEVKMVRSTTTYNKMEFAEYMEHVIRWAAQMGIILPTPEDLQPHNIQKLTQPPNGLLTTQETS